MNGPLLIQGAMDVETDLMAAQLTSCRAVRIGGFDFWSGHIGGRTVTVSRTGTGELNAACATVIGIQAFQPAAVINQGIAGGHTSALHVGDIVVGERMAYLND